MLGSFEGASEIISTVIFCLTSVHKKKMSVC